MGGTGDVKEEKAEGEVGQTVLKKGPWTAAEDAILMEYVNKQGEGNWNAVQKNSGLQRCGKSCRLRWANHLRPNLKKGSFSADEEMIIMQLHAEFGNKWARMAAHLPGRTDNEIKNYWNTRIKRRQKAGLPLYPLGIHQRMASRGFRKEQSAPWMGGALPPGIKSSSSPFSLFAPSAPPITQYPYRSVHRNPNSGKNQSFQLINFAGPIQYDLGNFDIGPSLPLHHSQPSYSVKMELPSSQFPANSGGEQIPLGNTGLLDALFQDSLRAGEKCMNLDSLGKLGNPDFSLGIHLKQESVEAANHEGSMLLDMIPKQMAAASPMTVLSDWLSNSNSGGDFSSGPSPAETATDEVIGFEMQQITPEHNWDAWDDIQWDTMPRIC